MGEFARQEMESAHRGTARGGGVPAGERGEPRPAAAAIQATLDRSPGVRGLFQLKRQLDTSPRVAALAGRAAPARSRTGLPGTLGAGVEGLSGASRDVGVHRPAPRGEVVQRVKGKVDLATLFPAADPEKIQDYGRISEMLEDSTRVQGHLEELNAYLEEHGDLQSALGYMEKASGFKPAVNVSEFLLEAQFMAHIAEGRQLIDPGAGLQHGPLTHRIQWWMVQNEINKAGEKGEPFTYGAADLYRGLAAKEMRFSNNTPGGETNTGWDAMFDRVQSEDVDRASRPEWFHPQMLNMGGEKQVLDTSRFPLLHAELMNQYLAAHDETKGMEGVNAWAQKPAFTQVDTPKGLVDGEDAAFNKELERQIVISQTAERVKATGAHSLGALGPEGPIGAALQTRELARKLRESKEASQHQTEVVLSNANQLQSSQQPEQDDFLTLMDYDPNS